MLGELAGRARDGGLQLLLSAFGHLLRQQAWARERLRPYAGRTLRMALDAPPLAGVPAPEALVAIDEQGLLQAAGTGARPDVTLLLKPSAAAALALLRDGPEGLQSHLRIEGDVMLSTVLGELAQHLRWDAEEDLSKVVGDVAAHRLVRFASQGLGLFRDLRRRAESAASQFLGSGAGPLTARSQMRALHEEAAELEQRVQALQARVTRLGGRRG